MSETTHTGTQISYEEAANAYPDLAASIERLHGKRRSRERRKLRDKLQLARLREKGAQCYNCVHFEASCTQVRGSPICRFHSDFHGYQITQADSLCLTHRNPSHE